MLFMCLTNCKDSSKLFSRPSLKAVAAGRIRSIYNVCQDSLQIQKWMSRGHASPAMALRMNTFNVRQHRYHEGNFFTSSLRGMGRKDAVIPIMANRKRFFITPPNVLKKIKKLICYPQFNREEVKWQQKFVLPYRERHFSENINNRAQWPWQSSDRRDLEDFPKMDGYFLRLMFTISAWARAMIHANLR